MANIKEVSYCLGMNIAQSLKQQGMTGLELESLTKAIIDYTDNKELEIAETEIEKVLTPYFGELQQVKFEKNIQEEIDFFAKNKDKEGVITLESGLQYEVIKEGEGEKPKETDQVTTHYHGTLLNGQVFDSSVDRNEPATFPVNGVIKGWVETLQLMSVGSKWKIYVPSELAYGANPHPNGPIEPHMTLVFEIELLSIN